MYFMVYFKSGAKKKVLFSSKSGPSGLYAEINKAIEMGQQFIMLNAEIIRLDAIERVEAFEG